MSELFENASRIPPSAAKSAISCLWFDTIDEKLNDLGTRVDGNTPLLNIVAGLNHAHEQRITKLKG